MALKFPCLCLVALTLVAPLHGAGEADDFRNLIPSARASGLGGAVVAQSGLDGAAMNPAAVGAMTEGALQASHLALIQDLSVEQLMVGWPVGFGTLGADLRFLQAPDLAGLDSAGNPTGTTVPTHESSLGLLWGGQWHGFGLGLGVNAVSLDLADAHGSGWSLDGGMQWALPDGLSVGASLRNGGWLNAVAASADALPAEAVLGATWSRDYFGNNVAVSVQSLRQGEGPALA